MTPSEPASPLPDALSALSGERWSVAQAKDRVRAVPGLYAVYGDVGAWADLGLDPAAPDSALYIGKSEDNLVRREIETHFAANPSKQPRTGSSTVRRSFAALLRDALDLHAVPRNPKNPERFSNYGLTPDGEARLTAWMHERLSLSVWERPTALRQPLAEVEVLIIRRWAPPLNIKDNPRPLPRLRLARETMAREASSGQMATKTTRAAPLSHESVSVVPTGARGLTPAELARELGKSPKTIRQALRDEYGKLPITGERWGMFSLEQESYLRARFR